MEDKKVKAGSVAVGICLFVIAILLVLIVVFYYNTTMEKNKLQAQIDELETEIEKKDEVFNNSEENNKIKEIILEGDYAIENSDFGYRFYKDGRVEAIGNVETTEGIYYTIGENKIELKFTKRTIYEENLDEPIVENINEIDTATIKDENTLCIKGEENGEKYEYEIVKYGEDFMPEENVENYLNSEIIEEENKYLIQNNSELDIDKLNCIIDMTKKVEDVNNYASTMKWSKYTMDDFTFEYPTGWTVQKMDDGIEEVRISGTAIGKSISKDEVGTNGNEVVSCDMIMIVYKPIECTEETEDVFFKDNRRYLGYGSEELGWYWYTDKKEGKYLYSSDYYRFYKEGEENKLIRARVLYSIKAKEEPTFKTTNIENYIFAEFKLTK